MTDIETYPISVDSRIDITELGTALKAIKCFVRITSDGVVIQRLPKRVYRTRGASRNETP